MSDNGKEIEKNEVKENEVQDNEEEVNEEPEKISSGKSDEPNRIILQEILQVDCSQRYNFHFISPQILLFVAGRSFQILNLKTSQVKKIISKSIGGIGALAIHPNKKIFAVAEKGNYPSIFVYAYPTLARLAELKGGTEKSYKHLEFSPNGDKLASLGRAPDYSLAIWDWKTEILNLKAKAFSQEVFRVSFSKFCDDVLITSGMSHIKFWNVANTFTGLKLKGHIGKFGAVQMTDVFGFEVFPDGKVLSGSEGGDLLLWESYFVKSILRQKNGEKCHK